MRSKEREKKRDREKCMYAHPDVCIDWGLTSLTLGTNTKHSVVVEQNIMKMDIMTKAASCCSRSTNDKAAPITHMITTLYTLIPMYLESLSAGMLTCRVSHARKQPKACKEKQKKALNIMYKVCRNLDIHHII